MTAPTQEFTAKNLGWMRRHRRQFGLSADEGKVPRTRADWEVFLAELERNLSDEKFSFDRVKVAKVKKGRKFRQIASTKSLNEVLVLRRINENIRRAYGIKNPNRSALVSTIRQAIQESTQKSILRVDIKSCFESIPKSVMLRRLVADGVVSFQTVSLLSRLFLTLEAQAGYESRKGLPRGLAISSTLAEIYLSDLEREIRSLPGVYLVARYVDDIVVISSEIRSDLFAKVRSVVRTSRLKLNVSKTNHITVACDCSAGCNHGVFCPCIKRCECKLETCFMEYLGYSFQFNSRNAISGANVVKVLLSNQKIKKIKSRIFISSRAYAKTGNFELYLKRLNYIVGNLQLISESGNRGLSTGLAYTHSEYSLAREQDASEGGSLTSLNDFLHGSIRFSLKLRPQPPSLAKQAFKYDFLCGYFSRRRVKLSRDEIGIITECWRNV
ncbi:RNA-directed DNA polymerase [Xanthomonas cerealis pv. cerealis]|uniref:RNA-directed DNA polymerase n=1 Tax=Xanthomonas cerealis pv. cerealis TaxID=152263 RepID=A0A514EFN2_9XANT|nr:RNA-directed DNA polymerase [Xanthomonas translucens pv. cerealis]